MKKFFVGVLTLLMMFLMTGCGGNSEVAVRDDTAAKANNQTPAQEGKYKIYLITIDAESLYWKSLDEGCKKAVEEIRDIDYSWIAPLDSENQSDSIDKAVADGANAILIAAASVTGVNESLQKATDAGVKIIYVDCAANYDNYVAALMTDNEQAGKIAAQTLQKVLADAGITSGTIGVVSDRAETQSTILRMKGFRPQFDGTNFELSDTVYMNEDFNNIKKFAAAHPEYVAFFGANEQTTKALGEQIKDSRTKQIIVGFDTSDEILSMVNDGTIYATMQQNPVTMGYEGMKIAVDSLEGKFTEKNFKKDTGVNVLTKENL